MLRSLLLLFALLVISSCNDECEGPIDQGDFNLSDLAKSYNPFPAEGGEVVFVNQDGEEKTLSIITNLFKELGSNSYPVQCPADTTQIVSGSSKSDYFRIELYDEVEDRFIMISIAHILDSVNETSALSIDGEYFYIAVGEGQFLDRTAENSEIVLEHIISLGNRDEMSLNVFSNVINMTTILGKQFFEVIEDAHPTLVRESFLNYNREVGVVSFQIAGQDDEWVFDRFE